MWKTQRGSRLPRIRICKLNSRHEERVRAGASRGRYPRIEAGRIYLWNLRPDYSGLSLEVAAYLAGLFTDSANRSLEFYHCDQFLSQVLRKRALNIYDAGVPDEERIGGEGIYSPATLV